MKMRKLNIGDELQVGDKIRSETSFGMYWNTVFKTTPKFAYVKWNDIAEGKFDRVFKDSIYWGPLPRPKWPMTQYSAWREIKEGKKIPELAGD